jgi:uncharacterized protein (DUF2164 family)
VSTISNTEAIASDAPKAATPKAPLDDVMLAMDVVDTLRHRQDLVARELSAEAREKQLLEKLRDIYHSQGIEVPDSVLREGVAALNESRFVYEPPKPGLMTTLARLYVGRKRWGPAALAFALVLIIGLGGYFLAYRPFVAAQQEAARIELAETLPAQMDALYDTIFTETKVQQAAIAAEEQRNRGKAAAAEGNREGALAAIAELGRIRDRLRQEYTLRIVNRPGADTGFWRFPESNTDAANYYIVVEALDPEGTALSLPIRNEETGKTETVSIWGVRVPEAVYRAVEADKSDDGIIQRSVVGLKQFGFLDVDYAVPVLGGAVTRW